MLEELTHMDRITQLQDEIQQLLQIMASSLLYLTTRTTFTQTSAHVPVTRARKEGRFDPPDVIAANRKELVRDLIVKAKQIECLIESLPVPESDEVMDRRLRELNDEMNVANEEYAQALDRAKNLYRELTETMDILLADPAPPLSEETE